MVEANSTYRTQVDLPEQVRKCTLIRMHSTGNIQSQKNAEKSTEAAILGQGGKAKASRRFAAGCYPVETSKLVLFQADTIIARKTDWA
jgi:hypothetical protein